MSTPDRERFLEAMLPAQLDAERAMHNGDVAPRLSTWSHADPVTLEKVVIRDANTPEEKAPTPKS